MKMFTQLLWLKKKKFFPMRVHLNCPNNYVTFLDKFVSSQKLYRQVVSLTIQYFQVFFLGFHVIDAIIAKIKKCVQSLVFKTELFASS